MSASFFKKSARRLGFAHFVLGLSLLSVLAVITVAWIGYDFYRGEFPDVAVLRTRFPYVEYRGHGKPWVVKISKTKPENWVSLPEVSQVGVGAVLVSEDWAFFQHKGYDANQIREAMKDSWVEGRLTRGASTITQQVVKNVFLEADRNLWRKLKELWLAVQLEEAIGKRRILEVYLNIAEWGEGIFGIRQAARHYFGKEPGSLTAKEGAFLAMLLPSPKRYSQSFRSHQLTSYARRTISRILGKMEKAHYLSESERVHELVSPLSFERYADGAAPQYSQSELALGSDDSDSDPDDEREESQALGDSVSGPDPDSDRERFNEKPQSLPKNLPSNLRKEHADTSL